MFRNQAHIQWSVLIAALFTVGILPGCGGSATDAPKTVAASGTVMLDGQPLAGATLQFLPSDPKGMPASGSTDAEGKFNLFSGSTSGAVPGDYKVLVEHYIAKDGKAIDPSVAGDIQQMKMAGLATLDIPPKYVDPNSTDLKVTVKEGETIALTLTK